MTTYTFNPTTNPTNAALPTGYVTTAGVPGTPGAGDTVYVSTLPTMATFVGTSYDLTGDILTSIALTLTNFTAQDLYLLGGNTFNASAGPFTIGSSNTSGPVSLTLTAGATVTLSGTLSGQTALAAPLDALRGAVDALAALEPTNVVQVVDTIDSNKTLIKPQTSGTGSVVTLQSSAAQATDLTVGTLGPALTIAFQGGYDTLRITGLGTTGGALADTITGFSDPNDTIDLAGVGALASYTANSVTTTGGQTYTLSGLGTQGFVARTDSAGNGIQINPCYAEGTRILTDRGEAPIERLTVGDRVVSALDGVARPILWCGARASAPGERAVIVHAGAFGPGLPHRDLTLSPDHAILFEGVLIPVRHLIDGAMVALAPPGPVMFWHLELAAHDAVLAEGLPAESLLDMGERAGFGGCPHADRNDVARAWEARGCAPIVISGHPVRRARALISRHAPPLAA